MKEKRIYLVTPVSNDVPPRLIEADSKTRALSYAARTFYTVKLASQHELVTALVDGREVEVVGADETARPVARPP
jgi:hypothetical protein